MSTWPPRKINILTDTQSSKISVWVCDKMSTWQQRKINIPTVSHRQNLWMSLWQRMSTWPPRKINILTVQSVVRDLCVSLGQNVDFSAAKNQHRLTVSRHRSHTEIFDKMSTWPLRKINILTGSQSSKITVWVCDKMSTWRSAKNRHPNCHGLIQRSLCESDWQLVDLTAAKNQHPNCQSAVKRSLTLCHKMSTWPQRRIFDPNCHSRQRSLECVTKMSTWPPRQVDILTAVSVVKDLMSQRQSVDQTDAKKWTS